MYHFEEKLTGGHHNSLGNTEEVVETVLNNHEAFDELFNCYFSDDELVRLRVSSAMKRLCKAEKKLLLPYLDRFLDEISKIDQASTQWTLAQLFLWLENDLSTTQKERALHILKANLAHHNDWIVLNTTIDTLKKWAANNADLKKWMTPHLRRLKKDRRKSVANRANKALQSFSS